MQERAFRNINWLRNAASPAIKKRVNRKASHCVSSRILAR